MAKQQNDYLKNYSLGLTQSDIEFLDKYKGTSSRSFVIRKLIAIARKKPHLLGEIV